MRVKWMEFGTAAAGMRSFALFTSPRYFVCNPVANGPGTVAVHPSIAWAMTSKTWETGHLIVVSIYSAEHLYSTHPRNRIEQRTVPF
jgi:hypothetical protein